MKKKKKTRKEYNEKKTGRDNERRIKRWKPIDDWNMLHCAAVVGWGFDEKKHQCIYFVYYE